MSDNAKILALVIGMMALAVGAAAVADGEYWRGIPVEEPDMCEGVPYDERDYPYDRHVILVSYWMAVGAWYSPYDDKIYGGGGDVDVEHRVAKKEAHISGLCRQDPEEWADFAQDTGNITIAGKHLNEHEKGDKDAAGWMPAENVCHFAVRVVDTKCKWGLSVDPAERDALESILSTDCQGKVEQFVCVNKRVKQRVEA